MAASGFAANHLRSFIHRIEQMDEEIKAMTDDRKEIYGEAKAHGFDTGIIRQVIKIRGMDPGKWEEKCALIETYLAAVNAPEDIRVEIRAAMSDDELPVTGHAPETLPTAIWDQAAENLVTPPVTA